jgi:hypothetical protein
VAQGAVGEEDDGQLADGRNPDVLALRVRGVPLRVAPRGAGRRVQEVPGICSNSSGSAASTFAACAERRTAYGRGPFTGACSGSPPGP